MTAYRVGARFDQPSTEFGDIEPKQRGTCEKTVKIEPEISMVTGLIGRMTNFRYHQLQQLSLHSFNLRSENETAL